MGQPEMLVIVLVVVILLLYYMNVKKEASGQCGYPAYVEVDEYAPKTGLVVESQCRDEQGSLNDRPSFMKRPPVPTRIPIQNTIYWQADKSDEDGTFESGCGAMNSIDSSRHGRGNPTIEGFQANLSQGKASRIQFQTDRS